MRNRREDETKPASSSTVAYLNGIVGFLLKTLLLVVLLVFIARNYDVLERNLTRMMTEAHEMSFGIFAIKAETIRAASSSAEATKVRWATAERVTGSLQVTLIAFDDNVDDDEEPERSEFFEIVAREWVDLGGGYVGDDSDLLKLDTSGLVLQPDDCLRIYTFVVSGDDREGECRRTTRARRMDDKGDEPIFRHKPGGGDRIIILDSQAESLLDFDYWPLPLLS